jgi:hypothetical protein
MSHIFQGDEWKHDAEPAPGPVILRQRTRAEQQAWIDREYTERRCNRAQWRFMTDLLSQQDALGNPIPQ